MRTVVQPRAVAERKSVQNCSLVPIREIQTEVLPLVKISRLTAASGPHAKCQHAPALSAHGGIADSLCSC
jgi:hypothetical protein